MPGTVITVLHIEIIKISQYDVCAVDVQYVNIKTRSLIY